LRQALIPNFFWLSEKHKEALASLKYGIQENKGFLLLTGDIGTGKTTFINCFLNENDTGAIIKHDSLGILMQIWKRLR
jgi:general secretion pathway protein A